ncbi:tRNA pseudouridine(54/55) synthase Pus10 [Candidatus Methanomassiliicoccus intestinalis]|uniref:tRNA pseudouridine(54/55) synthase Pus10 n=1 Tax=Candidatus Methanomassiliicoccus intestinalis TaxID=1406512 RepID=UPI0037DD3763
MNRIVARADQALQAHDLCDHCLGRLFAHVDTGMTNAERGRNMRIAVSLERSARSEELPAHEECWVCEEIFDDLERFANACIAELSKIEYRTFLVGTKVSPDIQDREERLWAEVGGDDAEPIKAELNREIGKLIEALTQKEVEFKNPDAVTLVDTRFGHVEMTITPLFIYGRYNKFSREIPQTKWPCRVCRGKGCERCHGLGKMYSTSVQEILGDIALEMAEGTDHFFHGMGREDIDAKMLGTGRPFILEISNPKKRSIDLNILEAKANESENASYSDLRFSNKDEVRKIKSAAPDKTYSAVVSFHDKVNKGLVDEVLQSLNQVCITQQTPVRVSHRRADLARKRHIREIHLVDFSEDGMVLEITAESGTYIKEFVSGDGGRTVPSISEKLGTDCKVTALDVIQILDNIHEV